MARDATDHSDAAKAHSVFIRLVLPPYTIHFKSPTYMQEQTLELLDNRVCKEVIKSSASSAEVREAIGSDPKFWSEVIVLLKAAVISLERRSFQIWDPSGADYESTSGALIASNYPGLWKDLERLNNVLSVSRNVLTAGVHVQDLAADHAIEHEIFKLINCAVRVTARGYDGEAGTGEEEKWQYVVNNYKKLLITSLQFLNNLVAQNERRKLMLWVNLFDSSSSDALLAQDDGQVNVPAKLLKEPEPPITREDLLLAYGEYGDEKLDLEGAVPPHRGYPFEPLPKEAIKGRPNLTPSGYVYFNKLTIKHSIEDYQKTHNREATKGELFLDLPRRWAELSVPVQDYWQKKWEATEKQYHNDIAMYKTRVALMEGGQITSNGTLEEDSKIEAHLFKLEDELHERYNSELPQVKATEAPLYRGAGLRWTQDDEDVSADTIDSDDMHMLFTAEAGTKILESGKAELMKRLEGYDKPADEVDDYQELDQPPLIRRASAPLERSDPRMEPPEEAWSVASEDGRQSEEQEEDDYPGSTEDGRGLLTDVPLILGPSEIEVLPMIVMSGIVPPPSQLAQCKTQAEQNALINMHTVRCHLLFAQDNGRNLLRELLIFVAAWDLREEELYFKFMVKIMEAILANGLMPYAYHAFRDRSRSKDIISPAQAVIMKLLTNIFRARSEANKGPSPSPRPTLKPSAGSTSHSLLPSRPQRVDMHILNYIFTEFRQHIIPQTCALIFLQGQIHLGRASPEDFPLNLWDMERMYEGVYQYLEFFAVLTEEGFWKNVLGSWQIASELVTLLRELEGGIPKIQIHIERVSRSSVQQDRQLSMPNLPSTHQMQRASSADARVPSQPAMHSATFEVTDTAQPHQPIFEAETPLAYPEDAQDEPSDFEWRNLKKLTVLVLSSLIWKNGLVQDQVRHYGGLEALVACCKRDEHNPYIREHAIMCLRFAVEENNANTAVIREMSAQGERRGRQDARQEYGFATEDVPREVLDANGYETFMDSKGQIGLRKKEAQLPTVPTLASSSQARPMLPPMHAAGMAKVTPEKAAELMQNALKELPLGMGASLAKGFEGMMKQDR